MPKTKLKPVPFKQAIESLRRRLQINPAVWDALVAGADIEAATIASQSRDALADDFTKAILEIMERGGTLADFKSDYQRIMAASGWSNPKGAGWHSELVYRVQVGAAQAAGRWQQAQETIRANPNIKYYFRYVTAGDHRVRDLHSLWHDVVLPVDHRFWLTHWPPNGFQCRCKIQLLSEIELRRYKLKLTDPNDPLLRLPPDEGWTGNVGLTIAA